MIADLRSKLNLLNSANNGVFIVTFVAEVSYKRSLFMFKNLAFSVFSLLLFSHCTQENTDIRVGCETIPPGNYLIKWETFPPMEGIVKIYESSFPDSFNMSSPIAESEISKGFKDIFAVRTLKRSYFKLVFDKNHSAITTERIIPMQGLFNFRDLGGYYNGDARQVRWGKLYRSSSLARATLQDVKMLNNLGIRTVIDFRTEKERRDFPPQYLGLHTFDLPLRGNPHNVFLDRIVSGKMRIGDVKVYAQDIFAFLVESNTDFFVQLFDILLNAENYPVLMHCSLGSDRSAVASALILAALEIDNEQIISDYMQTNEQIDFSSFVPNFNVFSQEDSYSREIKETITALYRVHKETITYSFAKILKDYGSLENYFNNELQLTVKKREKLKELMLY
jgi:protein-tyrosine phosphatase